MKQTISINNQLYSIETPSQLTQEQLNEVISKLSKMNTLATTCKTTATKVDDTITIKTNGTNGTPPYTAYFSQTGGSGTVTPSSVSNLAASTDGTSTYKVLTADDGKTITFSSYVTDNCTQQQSSTTQSCDITIGTASDLNITSLDVIPSTNELYLAANGWAEVTIGGSGIGDITVKKNGILAGIEHQTASKTWPIIDYFKFGIGTFKITAITTTQTLEKSITLPGGCTIPICNFTIS